MRIAARCALASIVFVGLIVGAEGHEFVQNFRTISGQGKPVAPLGEPWRGVVKNIPVINASPDVDCGDTLGGLRCEVGWYLNAFAPLPRLRPKKHTREGHDSEIANIFGRSQPRIGSPIYANFHVASCCGTAIFPNWPNPEFANLPAPRMESEVQIKIHNKDKGALSRDQRAFSDIGGFQSGLSGNPSGSVRTFEVGDLNSRDASERKRGDSQDSGKDGGPAFWTNSQKLVAYFGFCWLVGMFVVSIIFYWAGGEENADQDQRPDNNRSKHD